MRAAYLVAPVVVVMTLFAAGVPQAAVGAVCATLGASDGEATTVWSVTLTGRAHYDPAPGVTPEQLVESLREQGQPCVYLQ